MKEPGRNNYEKGSKGQTEKNMEPENQLQIDEKVAAIDLQEKSRIATILVLRGHSSNGKSQLGRKLAEYLELPLINQEDIAIALENSFPTSSSSTGKNLINDLAFETVCQITSTQLNLKIGVIVSTPLSRHAKFERLKKLAIDAEARMIIFKCKSNQDVGDDDDEYYDVGNIPTYTVDPTEPLDPEELASTMSGSFEIREEPWRNHVKRDEMLRHLHELALFEELPKNLKKPICQKCHHLISSGPIYHCAECQEFMLHKSCAELLDENVQQLLSKCPSFLKSKTPEYRFPRTSMCQVCERENKDFSYDCFDCLLQTHMECAFLPTVISTIRHEHSLSFLITPVSFNYEYLCCACGEFGKSISYKCYKCNYDLHIDCAQVTPKTMPSKEQELDDLVDAKADDFINTFKQQLKLQRLDSILRYREILKGK